MDGGSHFTDKIMENPTPFDLNEAIRRWQENLGASPAFGADNLEELASHLRASVGRLKATGLSEEEAFVIAARRIGEQGALEREFAKVNPAGSRSWAVVSFWIVAGIYLCQAAFALVVGVGLFREMLFQRKLIRLIHYRTASLNQIYDFLVSSHGTPLSLTLELSLLVVLVFILGARLGAGSWKRLENLIRIFKRPILPALGLAGLGVALTLLPEFAEAYRGRNHVPLAAYLNGAGAVNAEVSIVLVLSMVLLARRGLRRNSARERGFVEGRR